MVHVISILNDMRYAPQVNRHSINILMDEVEETSKDVNNLYNLTTSLATSLSYLRVTLPVPEKKQPDLFNFIPIY